METKTLHLTLSKKPFEVMVTGEKPDEFRKPSEWVRRRLYDKNGNPREYDVIKCVNGYGHDKPFFIAEYKGFDKTGFPYYDKLFYSNMLLVEVFPGDFIIHLGKIISTGNLKTK